MGIEINHYDTPANDFEKLIETFPKGKYWDNANTFWFVVYISEMNAELTWFRKRE